MWLLIDGDNGPGTRTAGSNKLNPLKDKMIVFYGAQNTFYNSKKNQEKLRGECACEVSFIRIEDGSNAVDFAMAVYASQLCAAGDTDLFVALVSGDKHLNIVARELRRFYKNEGIFKSVQTVDEAVMRFQLLEVQSAEDIRNVFSNQYGDFYGRDLFLKLKECFAMETMTVSVSANATKTENGIFRMVFKHLKPVRKGGAK